MNNIAMLMGRTTADVELKQTTSGKYVSRFTLAVDRPGKDNGTDFVSCVAFSGTAELLSKHVKKGNKILVSGRIQTGSYEKNSGEKVYTTDVIVNSIEFCGGKKEESKAEETKAPYKYDVRFEEMTNDEDLPF